MIQIMICSMCVKHCMKIIDCLYHDLSYACSVIGICRFTCVTFMKLICHLDHDLSYVVKDMKSIDDLDHGSVVCV